MTVPEILVEATASALGAVVGTYARFRLGTTAILGYLASSTARRARNLIVGNGGQQTWEDFSGHVKLETAYIPADTNYLITLLAGSGGSETGAGIVYVHIDFFILQAWFTLPSCLASDPPSLSLPPPPTLPPLPCTIDQSPLVVRKLAVNF